MIKEKTIEECNAWYEEFPYDTKEALIFHAKSIGQPAIDYYNKVFHTEEGDCYNVRQTVEVAQIFIHCIYWGNLIQRLLQYCIHL